MSKYLQHTESDSKHEQGAMRSYTIGFMLSLLFTYLPYLMVVHHTARGAALLAIILGFALLQMLVQITFFLHLGRGPKPRWNLYFFIGTIGVVLIVVGGSIMIIHNLHYNMSPSDQAIRLVSDEGIPQVGGLATGACSGQHPNHQIIIKNNAVSPLHTVTAKCDTLTFIDEDNGTRILGFGTYAKNVVYAGESDFTLQKGQNVTITLSTSGTYAFHDHLNQLTTGDFTVLP